MSTDIAQAPSATKSPSAPHQPSVTQPPPTSTPAPAGAASATRPQREAKRRVGSATAYWQHLVLSRVAYAEDELADALAVADGPTAAKLQRVRHLLDVAYRAATTAPWRPRVWLTGSAANQAFTALHAARVLLVAYVPESALDGRARSAVVQLKGAMPAGDACRRAVEDEYRLSQTAAGSVGVARRRWVLRAALEWRYAAVDAQYARLRSFRNVLYATSAMLWVLAGALAAMGAHWPASLPMCFGSVCPTGATGSFRDAFVIEVLGATGGMLAAVFAVRKLQGTIVPYDVPLALAMLKVPLGALSALLGLLLIHGQIVPGLSNLDTSGQILAYAVLLGVGQQAFTGMIDRRGQQLLEKIPSKGSQPAGTGDAQRGDG
jgi:hypothetical protein